MKNMILEIKNLETKFFTDEGVVPAVDGLDLKLHEGETLAIVGESGCGKSVTSMSILRLIPSPPGRVTKGEIVYKGQDLLKLSEKEMRDIRGNEISMIFQEPMTSLNPVFTIGKQIMESLKYHQIVSKEKAYDKAVDMIRLVGIPTPEKCMGNYPHQLSGGMRQRVMIAMALACNPKILIADEPTTALDVTIQAQILRLMEDLKQKTNTSIIMITHDLGIVAQIAENVMVMYAGQAVEYGDVESIFEKPLHPYTVGLLKSIPKINEDVEELYTIKGMVPGPRNLPNGCRFSPRCEYSEKLCETSMPPLIKIGNCNVRCFRYAKGGGTNG